MPTTIPKGELPFFDLKTYFNNQVDQLNKDQVPVKKTITFEGKTETKELKALNFEDELKLFIDSDINKTSWTDKYQTDSILTNSGKLQQVNYTAKDETLRTRAIRLFYDRVEAIAKIEIHNLGDGLITRSEQFLTFEEVKGYQIKNLQKVTLSDERELIINVEFLK